MNDTTITDQSAAAPAPLTPAKGLLTLGIIIVMVVAFIAINHFIGIVDFWPGFLFILYWSSFEHLRIEKLPHCIVGASIGLLVAYALQTLPHAFGPMAAVIPISAIILMVYCQLMGWQPLFVNTATMLFLTVATMPALQMHGNFVSVFSGFGIGVVFFSALVIIGNKLKERTANK